MSAVEAKDEEEEAGMALTAAATDSTVGAFDSSLLFASTFGWPFVRADIDDVSVSLF